MCNSALERFLYGVRTKLKEALAFMLGFSLIHIDGLVFTMRIVNGHEISQLLTTEISWLKLVEAKSAIGEEALTLQAV